ncbi:MAG TPA: dTDP-4-amino-4,6-dideoxygalactose transaminase [Chitinophagales bacterium]|nr:dTDP-4-amino-4,6-dideoxygalactose transaminase [Chitinophagales bacterium]
MIPFNKPSLIGSEHAHMSAAFETGKLSGNGLYTHQCHHYFEQHFGVLRALLTHSCTGALEMSALLCNIKPGDEVIMPTYTFVSTANAFALRGAMIKFVDSKPDHPVMQVEDIEPLVNEKTKAIVVVHYGGYSVDMQPVLDLAIRKGLFVVEDAAQAIGSRYHGVLCGTIGHFGAFSFHETKNVHCGEGGLLAVNDERYADRAEVIWEKGTNRSAFFRGEASKYEWMDLGSSFLPSELQAAWLWGQLEHYSGIRSQRAVLWQAYREPLMEMQKAGYFELLEEQAGSTHNHHLVAVICKDSIERGKLIQFLEKQGVMAVSHYLCLHKSPYYSEKHDGREMPNALRFERNLLRLPLFHDLSLSGVEKITEVLKSFYA